MCSSRTREKYRLSLKRPPFHGGRAGRRRAAQAGDPEAAAAFHLGLLNRGVFVAPRGTIAVSTVTDEQDVGAFAGAAREFFAR